MPAPSRSSVLPVPRPRVRRRTLPLVVAVGAGLLTSGAVAPAVASADGPGPTTSVEPFGTAPDGTPVERWTLSNGDVTMRVLTWGGVIQTLEVPDAHGHRDNVVLGFADLAGYVSDADPYFGALIGRYGNRIAGGTFTLDGTTYHLPVNNGPNTLHGGPTGFDDQVWEAADVSDHEVAALRLHLVSPDGDQGFPGTLSTTVTYTLDADGRLR